MQWLMVSSAVVLTAVLQGIRPALQSSTARGPDPAFGEQAVEQQQERIVRRRAIAGLGVRRVARAVQPAGVLARLEPDQLRAVRVAEQTGAARAARQLCAVELEPGADGDRHDD